MYTSQLFSLAALPAFIHAATFDVTVGGSNLVFKPDHITAAQGDLINFYFASAPVSIAQSTFDEPCVPSKNGIWSGQVVVVGPTVCESQDMFYKCQLN